MYLHRQPEHSQKSREANPHAASGAVCMFNPASVLGRRPPVAPALAETAYPAKPIRMVLPFSPVGTSDTLADAWVLYDNSGAQPVLLEWGENE